MRLAIVVSHPIQYYAPLFRTLATRLDLHVFYGQSLSPERQSAGFGQPFQWDVDLLAGYPSSFLTNVARDPRPEHFLGCDTPQIGARLGEGRFDAVLVMGWYLKTFVQAIWAARRMGLPVMVRGDSQLGTPRSAPIRITKAVTYPPLLRVFDAALYVGQRSRAYFEHYRYPPGRLFFSPHCIDTDWFATRATAKSGHDLRDRLGISREDKVVLFAGKLLPFKRPLDAVEALALDPARGAHLLVAGAGELEPAMRTRAAELGVQLHLTGFLNQSEMPAAYAAADVLALPSTGRETWGLVANEALACGVPLVLSDAVGCAPDLAADGKAGRVFPLGDHEAFSRRLAEVFARPPAPAAIAERSAAYDLQAAAAGIEQALGAVARHPPD